MRKPSRAVGKASHHCDRGAGTDTCLFPVNRKLAAKANTQLAIITEVLAGGGNGWSRGGRISLSRRICIFFLVGDQLAQTLYLNERLCCRPDHPIHQEPEPLSEVTRVKFVELRWRIPLVSARC